MDARDKGTVVLKLNKRHAPSSARRRVKAVLVVRHEDGTTQRVKVRLKR